MKRCIRYSIILIISRVFQIATTYKLLHQKYINNEQGKDKKWRRTHSLSIYAYSTRYSLIPSRCWDINRPRVGGLHDLGASTAPPCDNWFFLFDIALNPRPRAELKNCQRISNIDAGRMGFKAGLILLNMAINRIRLLIC